VSCAGPDALNTRVLGRVVLGLAAARGKHPRIVSTVRIGDDPLCLPKQSHGFRGSLNLQVRHELEPARAQHRLGVRDPQERLDERARRGFVVPVERSRRVDHDEVSAPRMLGGKRGLDRLATRPDEIVVLDPQCRREQQVGRLDLRQPLEDRAGLQPAPEGHGVAPPLDRWRPPEISCGHDPLVRSTHSTS
jgi:hypothetical protein